MSRDYATRRVSAEKTTECCFFKRCETKQEARQAVDLRRRRLATMRLEGLVKKKQLSVVFSNGVRQSKEQDKPQTCVGDVSRLCDSKG